jgi:hypothetical protein
MGTMGSGLEIDIMFGSVFGAEDQQRAIQCVEVASRRMWNVRPDPVFFLDVHHRITASRHRGGDAADADRVRAGPGLGAAVRRRSPEPLDTDRRQRHHRCGGGARDPRTDEQITP